ncbi:imidazolonepropionase [soil metagenome]
MSEPQVVITGARLATMARGGGEIIDDGALVVTGERISWVGPGSEVPTGADVPRWDAGGRLVTPGLVDCHTHLVFGGDRADEFEQRLLGASCEDLAAGGGGIAATVRATRAATDDELAGAAERRLTRLAAGGVTTVEVKSGYGLDTATELRMLATARALPRRLPVDVGTTFLGAHTVPDEYAHRPDAYVELVCDEMLPAVAAAGSADAVDVFCESIAFDGDQAALVLGAARRLGLPVKVHADQLSDMGAAALAARFGALSADHLEHTSPAGVAALAAAGTVAVLLPGAACVLGGTARPPVEALRATGVPMALATDANPGTSPLLSLPLAMSLGCALFGLTPVEALAGVTRHAAVALGRHDRGVLAAGRRADLVVWDAERVVDLVYWMGAELAHTVMFGGRFSQHRSGRRRGSLA